MADSLKMRVAFNDIEDYLKMHDDMIINQIEPYRTGLKSKEEFE